MVGREIHVAALLDLDTDRPFAAAMGAEGVGRRTGRRLQRRRRRRMIGMGMGQQDVTNLLALDGGQGAATWSSSSGPGSITATLPRPTI